MARSSPDACSALRDALGAIFVATVIGCRSAALAPAREAAPTAVAAPAHSVEHSGQITPPIKTFTIAFTTFIPADQLVGPVIHPQSYARLFPPARLVFAGDGRTFDVDAKSFRSKQVITIIPDAADDADGLLEGSKQNLGGITESFEARPAVAGGRIDPTAGAQDAGVARVTHATITVKTDGMIIDDPVRLGPHCVFVRLRTARAGGPRNGLIAGSPSIDWDIGVTIDTSGPEPTYEIVGTWDGYPAAELYINRQPVLLLAPGTGQASPLDLLRLLPVVGDRRLLKRGRLEKGDIPM